MNNRDDGNVGALPKHLFNVIRIDYLVVRNFDFKKLLTIPRRPVAIAFSVNARCKVEHHIVARDQGGSCSF